MKVLVTGAAGMVAQGVVRELERHFQLRLLDQDPPPTPSSHEWVTGSFLDPEILKQALPGAKAVVHLASARKRKDRTPTTDDYFDVNVKGLFKLMDAAAVAGVERFVHVSSTSPIIGHWYQGNRITQDSPLTSQGRYSLTKGLQEVVCEHMARNSPMHVIVLRLWVPCGWTQLVQEGSARSRSYHPGLVDTEDFGQACAKAIQSASIKKFELLHIMATPEAKQRFDTSRADEVLGFEPKHDFRDLIDGHADEALAGDRPA